MEGKGNLRNLPAEWKPGWKTVISICSATYGCIQCLRHLDVMQTKQGMCTTRKQSKNSVNWNLTRKARKQINNISLVLRYHIQINLKTRFYKDTFQTEIGYTVGNVIFLRTFNTYQSCSISMLSHFNMLCTYPSRNVVFNLVGWGRSTNTRVGGQLSHRCSTTAAATTLFWVKFGAKDTGQHCQCLYITHWTVVVDSANSHTISCNTTYRVQCRYRLLPGLLLNICWSFTHNTHFACTSLPSCMRRDGHLNWSSESLSMLQAVQHNAQSSLPGPTKVPSLHFV